MNSQTDSLEQNFERARVARDLEAMLEVLEYERLREIDLLLRQLPDDEVLPADLELMFSAMLVWLRSGRGREGFPLAVKGVRCARKLGDSKLLRRMLTARGVLAGTTLDVGVAIECHLEAMQIAESLDDDVLKGNSLLNLGLACSYLSLDIVALKCFREALAIARRLDMQSGLPRGLECITLCALAGTLTSLGDYRAALQAARDCQTVGRKALSDLEHGQKVQIADSMAISQCCEVSALVRLGMHEQAHSLALELDQGSAAANVREGQARIARAEVAASRGDVNFAIQELQSLIRDPTAKHHRRAAMASLVECYEALGWPDAALSALQELQAEIEAARREVALEDLRCVAGVDPYGDKGFEENARSRMANYRIVVDGTSARLSSKLHYLEKLAVSSEIREGNEADRAEHIYRVGALCSLLAAESGCSEELCWLAEVAGRLHDIGKSSIPDSVILIARPLSERERSIVHGHSDYGARLITGANEPRLVQVVAAVRHHHERFDGCGYPSKLSAGEIPLLGRIVAISDSFDAMLQSRTYRASRSVGEALQEIERGAGTQFDPRLAGLFIRMVNRIQLEVEDLSRHLGEQGRSSSTVTTFARLSRLFNETPVATL